MIIDKLQSLLLENVDESKSKINTAVRNATQIKGSNSNH